MRFYQIRKYEKQLTRQGITYRKKKLKLLQEHNEHQPIKKCLDSNIVLPNTEECNFPDVVSSVRDEDLICSIQNSNLSVNDSTYPSSNFVKTNDDLDFSSFYDSLDNFNDQLSLWAIKNHISGSSVDELLYILRQKGHDSLPKSHKTLSKKNEEITVKTMGTGCYYVRNLRDLLVRRLKLLPIPELKTTYLVDWSSDGAPVGKNSVNQFWPVALNFREDPKIGPIVWSCYVGKHKPSNPDIFTVELTRQVVDLQVNPIILHSKKIFVKLNAFKGDLPAIALFLGIKSPGGYFSCRLCHSSGVYSSKFRKMLYKDTDSLERTDAEFRAEAHISLKDLPAKNRHVIRESEFLNIPNFDCVQDVDIDGMHALLHGETKKVISKWFFINNPGRLALATRKTIEVTLSTTFDQFPCEFNRHGRPFSDVSRWKATELKAFLLYQFLVVYPHLPSHVGNHFLLLFCGVRILSSWRFFKKFNNVAAKLLTKYVIDCLSVYGEQHYDLVTHLITHLSECGLKNTKPIFEESCFVFENSIKCIKDMIKSGPKPLQQIANRISERETFLDKFMTPVQELPLFNERQRQIKFSNFTIKPDENNCFVMTKDRRIFKYVEPKIINNLLHIAGAEILNLQPAFLNPLNSTFIDIFVSDGQLASNKETFPVEQILYKMFHMTPNKNYHIYVPLEHSANNEFSN